MRYIVRHITHFGYSTPITESVTELRLQPRSEANQRCLSFGVATQPAARIFAFRDSLGNTIQHFDIPGHHRQLEIVSEALVELSAPSWDTAGLASRVIDEAANPPPMPADAWERLRSDEVYSLHFDDLHESQFAQFTPALRAFSAELNLPEEADPLTLALEMTTRLHDVMDYDSEATTVDSPIDDALAHRKGVCQDFSHIMIALCRLRGLPARYVSGYLYTGKDYSDRSNPGASHAWVELWLPTLGWVGFDPTNNLVAGERHIRVAVGRDYADVPPVRGVFKGGAESTLSVGVKVLEAPHDLPDAVAPNIVWPPIVSGELTASATRAAPSASKKAQQQQQQQQ